MKNKIMNILWVSIFPFLLIVPIYYIQLTHAAANKKIITDTSFSNGEMKGMIAQRVTYERSNLRYINQQEELQNVMDIFKKNENALNVVAHSFLPEDYKLTGIFFDSDFDHRRFYARGVREEQTTMLRCIMLSENANISFFYSSLHSYLIAQSCSELNTVLKNLNLDFQYALVYNQTAVFTLKKRYFKENEHVNFVFFLDPNYREYLTEGIRLGDGWVFEMVGYNQYNRDFGMYRDLYNMRDDAYPFPFFYTKDRSLIIYD